MKIKIMSWTQKQDQKSIVDFEYGKRYGINL